MTAAVGHPTLRLIRTQIGEYALGGLAPGASRVVAEAPARGAFARIPTRRTHR
jgi:23S rRNA pseudouridine2457 synthase